MTFFDPRIEEDRRIALDLLKPSARDLDRGLALHAAGHVIEAYGFAPFSAVDGARMKALVEAGASPDEIEAQHESDMRVRAATDPDERAIHLAAWAAAGVDAIFLNAGQETTDPMRCLRRLAYSTYAADLLKDQVCRAACPADLERAKAEGRRAVYLTANAVPMPQRWMAVEEELEYLRLFFRLGARMMHLTYNRRNLIGDGCGESSDAGLSDFGRTVVREMNRVGMIVDVAHAGFRTSLEAAQVSERPVMASHTAAHALHPHYRAKPDAVVKAIADTDGVVGVCGVPSFLGGSGDIRAMMDHIEYLVKLVGARHVAIGTDNWYMSPRDEAAWEQAPPRPPRRKPWYALWPKRPDGFVPRPEQRRSMAWTNWPLFAVGMAQRGLADDQIRAILGENVLRVARANWDGRTPD